MAAPYGNKNAEKWDSDEALKLFMDAIELTEEQETVILKQGTATTEVTGYKYDFIGEIASALGTFHQIFKHLNSRFPELNDLRSQLNNNIERNCYSNTKKSFIREAIGIVNLKSNWSWTDRQRIEHSGASVIIVVDKEAKDGIDELTGNG